MKDNKFKTMCILVAIWFGLFLLTMKVKSPRLEQVDFLILFIAVGWFAYWTISTIRAAFKKDAPIETVNPKPTEQVDTNAESSKKSESK